MIDWPTRIVELTAVKREIGELDTAGLWEQRPPNGPASAAAIAAAEAAIGEPLDPVYREFLSHAGGWPAFWQAVDLFGPEDLAGTPRFRAALAQLGHVDDLVLETGDLRRADLLPVAASPVDRDLFVMTRRSAPVPGTVIWLAGGEIDRYPGFAEFFLALTELNRAELEYFRQSI